MSKIYIETYGCSANQNNSEIIAGLLEQNGHEITNKESESELIIINSCVVKSKTENKIKRKIQDNKNKPQHLIVTGCMPRTDFKQIKQLNPDAIQIGSQQITQINEVMESISNSKNNQSTSDEHVGITDYQGNINHQSSVTNIKSDNQLLILNNKLSVSQQKQLVQFNKEVKVNLPKINQNKLIGITQISEGCLDACSFCKTKLSKGHLHSYSQEQILNSIKTDLENGAKEIWLTSQGNANYGLDRGKQELPELLRKIISLPYEFKIRLGMMNPNFAISIFDEILEIYKSEKMYKFIHIPVQSASNNVLIDMKRRYTTESVESMITKFRKEFPNGVIATDIIIGYPTEKDSDYRDSLNFIKDYKIDVLNLSKFSLHKKTGIYNQLRKSEEINEINSEVMKKRTAEIMRVHRDTALNNKQIYFKKTMKVFVNDYKNGVYEARDENYNIVLINNKESDNKEELLGKQINIIINKVGPHYMVGSG